MQILKNSISWKLRVFRMSWKIGLVCVLSFIIPLLIIGYNNPAAIVLFPLLFLPYLSLLAFVIHYLFYFIANKELTTKDKLISLVVMLGFLLSWSVALYVNK